MVLFKDFFPGTNVIVDYFGKRRAPNTFFQGVDLRGYYLKPTHPHEQGQEDGEQGVIQDRAIQDGGVIPIADTNSGKNDCIPCITDAGCGGSSSSSSAIVATSDNISAIDSPISSPIHEKKNEKKISSTTSFTTSLYQHTPVDHQKPIETLYVLSHFHSDHFMGMELNWQPERVFASSLSKIHCTQTTKTLLQNCFQISEKLIIGHEYLLPVMLDGLGFFESEVKAMEGEGHGLGKIGSESKRVKYCLCFVDGNHCPGSSIVLLYCIDTGKLIVNTGDIRVSDKMDEEIMEGLKRMRNLIGWEIRSDVWMNLQLNLQPPVDMMFLDFTWAHELFNELPTKESAIEKILRLVQNKVEGKKSILLFRSSGLGDEEILEALFSTYSSSKFVFLDKRRFLELKSINIIGKAYVKQCVLFDDLPKDEVLQQRFFIGNGMGIGFDRVKGIFGDTSGGGIVAGGTVLGTVGGSGAGNSFLEISCTTMWWAKSFPKMNLNDSMQAILDSDGVYHILWSMHSGLEELRTLVKFLKPKCLRPVCKPGIEDEGEIDFGAGTVGGVTRRTDFIGKLFGDLICGVGGVDSDVRSRGRGGRVEKVTDGGEDLLMELDEEVQFSIESGGSEEQRDREGYNNLEFPPLAGPLTGKSVIPEEYTPPRNLERGKRIRSPDHESPRAERQERLRKTKRQKTSSEQPQQKSSVISPIPPTTIPNSTNRPSRNNRSLKDLRSLANQGTTKRSRTLLTNYHKIRASEAEDHAIAVGMGNGVDKINTSMNQLPLAGLSYHKRFKMDVPGSSSRKRKGNQKIFTTVGSNERKGGGVKQGGDAISRMSTVTERTDSERGQSLRSSSLDGLGGEFSSLEVEERGRKRAVDKDPATGAAVEKVDKIKNVSQKQVINTEVANTTVDIPNTTSTTSTIIAINDPPTTTLIHTPPHGQGVLKSPSLASQHSQKSQNSLRSCSSDRLSDPRFFERIFDSSQEGSARGSLPPSRMASVVNSVANSAESSAANSPNLRAENSQRSNENDNSQASSEISFWNVFGRSSSPKKKKRELMKKEEDEVNASPMSCSPIPKFISNEFGPPTEFGPVTDTTGTASTTSISSSTDQVCGIHPSRPRNVFVPKDQVDHGGHDQQSFPMNVMGIGAFNENFTVNTFAPKDNPEGLK